MKFFKFFVAGPEYVRTRVRSWLWQQVLGTKRTILQASPQIIGHRHIRLGPDFRAGRMLWLEAVRSYGEQTFEPSLVIGARVKCSDSVHIACINQLTIGDDVLVGSKVHITDHNHGSYAGKSGQSAPSERPAHRALTGAPVIIEDRVFLADGVVVLPGSRIGAGTIVGANSVVSGTLPPDCLCVGIPARPIKSFDEASHSWQSFAAISATDLNVASDNSRFSK